MQSLEVWPIALVSVTVHGVDVGSSNSKQVMALAGLG